MAVPFVLGRPKDYDPDKLLPPIKAIWLHALQPSGQPACAPARDPEEFICNVVVRAKQDKLCS
jgi:hypothetical protein